MLLLVLSLAALLAGPLVVGVLGAREAPLALVDGFVAAALVGLVVVRLLPESIAVGGPIAVGCALVGLGLPRVLERRLDRAESAGHGTLVWLAMAGLGVHAMFDGAALASGGHEHAEAAHTGELLAAGIVLHRLSDGLAVWWVVRPSRGARQAALAVAAIALATVLGYAGAASFVRSLPLPMVGAFQALVAGSLFHVVVGHAPPGAGARSAGRRAVAAAGALLGIAAIAGLSLVHPSLPPAPGELGAATTFVTLACRVSPALLAGLALTGLFRALLPPGAGVRFLIAGRVLAIEGLLVTAALLGWQATAVRAAAAVVLAIAAGMIARERGKAPQTEPGAREPLRARLEAGLRHAFGEHADRVLPWVLTGVGVAALLEPLLPGRAMAPLAPVAAAAFGIGAVLAGGIEGAAIVPFAFLLAHKGLAPSVAVAMAAVAPAAGSTVGQVEREHGRVAAIAFVTLLVAVAAAVAFLVPVGTPLELHAMAVSAIGAIAAAVVAVLLVLSLLRQGPRGMIGRVIGEHEHRHEHDHEHVHEHADHSRSHRAACRA
jgi:uncharacterized protein